MSRAKFYAALRRSSLFAGGLSQPQVDGIEALLRSCRRNGVTDDHHVANIHSNVYRETGGYMLGVKETVMPYHKDKNPSDATVIARLDRAYAQGKLKQVRNPYWRDGGFGRGPIQVSHVNYARMGKRLGVNLVRHPEKLLEPDIGADSAVIGMAEGIYTGKKLSDFTFPAALHAKPKDNPRRIVNGRDGSDAQVAENHVVFFNALRAAGGFVAMMSGEQAAPLPPPPDIDPAPDPVTLPDDAMSWGQAARIAGLSVALVIVVIVAMIVLGKG